MCPLALADAPGGGAREVPVALRQVPGGRAGQRGPGGHVQGGARGHQGGPLSQADGEDKARHKEEVGGQAGRLAGREHGGWNEVREGKQVWLAG